LANGLRIHLDVNNCAFIILATQTAEKNSGLLLTDSLYCH